MPYFKPPFTGLTLLSFILLLFIAACNETGNSKKENPADPEKEVIKNQIENVYFGLVNGAYTSQGLSGTTPENLPFYNSDLSTLITMGVTPLAMINGPLSIEPKNIMIENISENTADVNYDLSISKPNTVEYSWIYKIKSTGEKKEFSSEELEKLIKDPQFKAKYEFVDRMQKSKQVVLPISMVVKKIGGKWKLDGQRFLPLDEMQNNQQ